MWNKDSKTLEPIDTQNTANRRTSKLSKHVIDRTMKTTTRKQLYMYPNKKKSKQGSIDLVFS